MCFSVQDYQLIGIFFTGREFIPGRLPLDTRKDQLHVIIAGVILSAGTVISPVSIYFFNLLIKELLCFLDGGFKKVAVRGRDNIQVYIGNQVQWLPAAIIRLSLAILWFIIACFSNVCGITLYLLSTLVTVVGVGIVG